MGAYCFAEKTGIGVNLETTLEISTWDICLHRIQTRLAFYQKIQV